MENRDLLMEVCTLLEATARDTFSPHGWPLNHGLNLHLLLRRSTLAHFDMCILVMQRLSVIAY
jgi:hypothetical protein